jgi:hypothetical protein
LSGCWRLPEARVSPMRQSVKSRGTDRITRA